MKIHRPQQVVESLSLSFNSAIQALRSFCSLLVHRRYGSGRFQRIVLSDISSSDGGPWSRVWYTWPPLRCCLTMSAMKLPSLISGPISRMKRYKWFRSFRSVSTLTVCTSIVLYVERGVRIGSHLAPEQAYCFIPELSFVSVASKTTHQLLLHLLQEKSCPFSNV